MGHRAAFGSGVTAAHGARRDGLAPAAGPKSAAEGRALREATDGATVAGSWYRRQAVRAVPRLLWCGLRTRFGWVALGVVGAWAVNLAVLASLGPTGLFDTRYAPTTQEVLGDTIVHGVAILLGGLVAGAVAALLSRGARLVPVVIVAAFCSLWAWEGPFYAVYDPGRLTGDGPYAIELGAWSHDLLLPAVWQLPTMSILMRVSSPPASTAARTFFSP